MAGSKEQKMPKTNNINIQQVAVGNLIAATYNPRKISAAAFEHLKESITRYGLVDPIIVNSTKERAGTVIGGHQRLKAAVALGYDTVPVIYLELDEAREKELNLRLNRNTGEWDWELLRDFDASLLLGIGFNDQEISSMFDDVLDIEDDHFTAEKVTEKPKSAIRVGDMFQLGRHILFCGDPTSPVDIDRMTGGALPRLLYVDTVTKGKRRDAPSLEGILEAALPKLATNLHVFAYCEPTHIGIAQAVLANHDLFNQQVCLWIKQEVSSDKQVFQSSYQPCVYATRGKPFFADSQSQLNDVLNKDIASGNRAVDDIIDLLDIWLATGTSEAGSNKPVTVHEKPLKRCTKAGDYVLVTHDPTGSILIACEQLNRIALICEPDPAACETAMIRWQSLTEQEAVRL